MRRATHSDLLNGKAGLSPQKALRIVMAFGMSMDTLLKMQAWFDARAMRGRADEIGGERFIAGAGRPLA